MNRRQCRSMLHASAVLALVCLAGFRAGSASARQEPHPGRHRRDDTAGEGQPRDWARACAAPACRRTGRGRRSAKPRRAYPEPPGRRSASRGWGSRRSWSRTARPAFGSSPGARGDHAHVLLHGVSRSRPCSRRPGTSSSSSASARAMGNEAREYGVDVLLGPRPQHPPQSARRPELRVLLGGSRWSRAGWPRPW